MPYLAAAVVLLGVLCLLNLSLTIGILRRMRAQAVQTGGPAGALSALGPGSSVGEFTAVTTDGEPVSPTTLTGVVGFFSSGCEPCHELLPRFVEHARKLGRENVLAVFGGDDEAAVRALTPVARVVVADRDGGPVARAFQNTWTPQLYLIGDDHRIVAVGGRMEELPLPDRHDSVAGKGIR
ncbi:TlpA family protein disulfide reductase [Sphaerisporangium perillae]|uniref:TlpA family protein disulfide reductase n=1 Tax=Sphaerisporangium perillae TaxID=2935860 RepID=UPI00200D058D|nr:TlpA disulfide reductase family protein [Sphaerisporangium perillae]